MSRTILSVEQAYVGCLLWLDTRDAARAHGWLAGDDLAHPGLQLIHLLVGQLVDAGVRPDPAAVLALAWSEDHVTGAHQIHELTKLLCQLYDHRATNPPSVRWYAAAALEEAVRRRTLEMADRLRQAASGDREPDELADLARAEEAALERILARRRAILEPPATAAA